MTEEQLKAIDLTTDEGKQELSRVAGEVLHGEHEWQFSGVAGEAFCPNCIGFRRNSSYRGELKSEYNEHCNIPLRWQEAMKWYEYTIGNHKEHIILHALGDLYLQANPEENGYSPYVTMRWYLNNPSPITTIKLCVLCEIRSKGDN